MYHGEHTGDGFRVFLHRAKGQLTAEVRHWSAELDTVLRESQIAHVVQLASWWRELPSLQSSRSTRRRSGR